MDENRLRPVSKLHHRSEGNLSKGAVSLGVNRSAGIDLQKFKRMRKHQGRKNKHIYVYGGIFGN